VAHLDDAVRDLHLAAEGGQPDDELGREDQYGVVIESGLDSLRRGLEALQKQRSCTGQPQRLAMDRTRVRTTAHPHG
jgi:hypothetical protein